MKRTTRNWKSSRPSIHGRDVPSTGSRVPLRLFSFVISGASVLFAVSCRSAKTVTQETAVALDDCLSASVEQGVSLRTAGGTPGMGTARIRIMLEPVQPKDERPDPKGESRMAKASWLPQLVIEAEANGSGGTAPEVDASSTGGSRVTRQDVINALTKQQAATGKDHDSGWRKARDALLWILTITLTITLTIKVIKRHFKDN